MQLEALTRAVTSRIAHDGFALYEAGDRHGSWEVAWVADRASGGHAFVTLALTPGQEDGCVEVWAGADTGTHFGRVVRETFHFPVAERHAGPASDIPDALVPGVAGAAAHAARYALAFPDTELTGARIPSPAEHAARA
jgi:hypothetical protein